MNKNHNQYDAYTSLVFSPWGEHRERVITKERYFEGNSRVSSRLPIEERSAYHMLITTGGGFVEGEKYRTDILVEDQASALLASQAPTYIYRCLEGKETLQEVHIQIEGNGILEYMMDDLIPYEQANFRQITTIELNKNSTLFYLDGVTRGWAHDDQDFAYEKVRLETKILMDGKLILSDHFLSEPKTYEEMKGLGLFEGYTNYNSFVVIHPNIDQALIKQIRAELGEESQVIYGISELEVPGFVLRMLSHTVDESKSLIYRCANFLRKTLLHFPDYDLRKNDYYEQII